MPCRMSAASYDDGCRCRKCTTAHKTKMGKYRRRGMSSAIKPQGRPRVAPVYVVPDTPAPPKVRYDCLTRAQIMQARGYSEDQIAT